MVRGIKNKYPVKNLNRVSTLENLLFSGFTLSTSLRRKETAF